MQKSAGSKADVHHTPAIASIADTLRGHEEASRHVNSIENDLQLDIVVVDGVMMETSVSVENIGGCEASMDMCPESEIQTVFRGHRVRVKMKQVVVEQRATECRTGAKPALTIRLSQP